MKQAMKSGIGSCTVELDGQYAGVMVSALAAVNAVGDVRDPATRARSSRERADRADKHGIRR